jgi:glycosyltransferase involved in cell wall biosynthesis
MHIGFDISQTGSGKAGCGFFSHAMIQNMLRIAPAHAYSLYPSFGDFYFDALMPMRNPYPGRQVNYGPRHISREAARQFWNRPDLESALHAPDIIQSNNFWCPAQQLPATRLVYTFHDMGFAVDPSWSTEANRIGCFEGVFRSAAAADWVVAVSNASREHYLRVFPHFPQERIRVVYQCSRFETDAKDKRPKALERIAPGEFWLNVGTVEPRKNQRRLAQAYARYLALGGKPMPLVLAGGKGWLMEDFQKHLQQLGITAQVVMTGYVSDEELVWLYRNCHANLYPSLFEGFGLPVLEGMQFGAPTLASDNSSLPEVAGDAAILLDACDTEAWAQAMLRISSDAEMRQRLAAAARNQAARFDWKASASELLALYEEAVAAPKRVALKQAA